MYEVKNSIYYQSPLALRTRLFIHAIINSIFIFELIFTTPKPGKELQSFLLLFSINIFLNVEVFLIHWFCQKKSFVRKSHQSSDESLSRLKSLINSNQNPIKVRVLKDSLFQAFLNYFSVNCFHCAIDENRKRYYVFIESVPKEEFIGNLYELHSKRFTLKQKYAVIPLDFETNREELKAS